MNYKSIHIGTHLKRIAELRNLSVSRACLFLKCTHQDILNMYTCKTLEVDVLLRWCKLLDYNFFMLYHSHLQLYKPAAMSTRLPKAKLAKHEQLYLFRKNLYSPDIIDWLLEQIEKKELTPQEIINKYHIPRTTIYRWIKQRQTPDTYELY